MLAALCLSWLGDVLLIPDDERIFRAGILAFLLGHVAFLAAFFVRGVEPAGCALVLVLVGPASASALRWLRPHLPAEMKAQVIVYVAVISLMVIAAAGTFALSPDWTILAGAVAFFCSDLSVARDRFVRESFVNRAWGLPLYYGRERRAGSSSERARLVVTKAIKASLERIDRNHPALGRLLATTIRTGTFCSYRPDPRTPADWQL